MWFWLAASGCVRPTPPQPAANLDVPVSELEQAGPVQVKSGRWEGGGFALVVPSGWSGVEGPAPRVVSVREEATGVEVALWAHPEPLDGPREVEGETCDFVDRSSHRTVPALGLSSTATCLAPSHLREVWWATLDGEEVHVEVITPRGRLVRGRQDTAAMLRELARVGSLGAPTPENPP